MQAVYFRKIPGTEQGSRENETGKKGKPTQGHVTSVDNQDSILLELSKEPCTCLRTVHPRDSLPFEREGGWEPLMHRLPSPLVKGCPLGY